MAQAENVKIQLPIVGAGAALIYGQGKRHIAQIGIDALPDHVLAAFDATRAYKLFFNAEWTNCGTLGWKIGDQVADPGW